MKCSRKDCDGEDLQIQAEYPEKIFYLCNQCHRLTKESLKEDEKLKMEIPKRDLVKILGEHFDMNINELFFDKNGNLKIDGDKR
jgi:hypothetical protein